MPDFPDEITCPICNESIDVCAEDHIEHWPPNIGIGIANVVLYRCLRCIYQQVEENHLEMMGMLSEILDKIPGRPGRP